MLGSALPIYPLYALLFTDTGLSVADVSVLADERGRFRLRDNEGTEVVADRLLRPILCLRAGVRHDATAPILPHAEAA